MCLLSKIVPAIAIIIVAISISSAAEIVLKNGDRITGRIVKKENNELSVETEAMGVVKIKLSMVERYKTTESLAVTLNDDRVLIGAIRSEGTTLFCVPVSLVANTRLPLSVVPASAPTIKM